ncbi:MAG: TSUP family transporter [Phycisphaerae bacterium]
MEIVLPLVALLTAALSAVIGMGGGILLLAAMFAFLPHAEAIPTHAAVQLASNGTRVAAFVRNVDWSTLGRFCVGVVPGMVVGAVVLGTLGMSAEREPYLKLLVGAYVLTATFLPSPRSMSTVRAHWWDFPLLGFVVGAAALTIGAIGPLIAPMFARRRFVKERLIATKATCQLLAHMMKIPAFLMIRPDLDVKRLGLVTVLMIAMVIPGTLIGKRVLKHVTDRHFVVLYRVALTVAGLKVLIVDGVLRLAVGD